MTFMTFWKRLLDQQDHGVDANKSCSRSYANFRIACSIRFSVTSFPSTSNVSKRGGAFLRPQTATRMG
jgi:hypothetical protein